MIDVPAIQYSITGQYLDLAARTGRWHFRRGKRCATLPDGSKLARRSTIVDERKRGTMAWITIMKAGEIISLPATYVLDGLPRLAESLVFAPMVSLTFLEREDILSLIAGLPAMMTANLQYLYTTRRL
jgi:hypothetical protein